MKDTTKIPIKYCLYARKSSESDEKQAMSIDGQLREMKALAKREKLNIVEIVTESHSAKESGERPKFNYILEGIRKGKYNAITTWAPDRISRNAGDLGKIVDLMDQKKLLFIKCHSQTFSNNPNEKFLLMILCSQAKLENDNRGINVKRGLKNKCEVGIRPCMAPIGYLNIIKGKCISTVIVDPEKAPVIKEMFLKVANEGYSGRMLKRWLDEKKFVTKNGCPLCLSRIYAILNNTFYYGEFEYGGKWFKGTHEPLISKQIFNKVQFNMQVVPKQWNKQIFPFKKLCICGGCNGNVTAEIKYRKLKSNKFNTHIYYHCNRVKDYDCEEPYVTEEELIRQIVNYLPEIKLDVKYLMTEFNDEIKRLNHLRQIMLKQSKVEIQLTPHNTKHTKETGYSEDELQMLQDYLLHILQFGTPEERIKILGGIKSRFRLSQRRLEIIN